MLHRITVLPAKKDIEIAAGTSLLDALRQSDIVTTAPCGGNGLCGKCKVTVDNKEALACQVIVDRDMTVALPPKQDGIILADGISAELSPDSGICLAIDIGTTTVAAYLMEKGEVLAVESRHNPQCAFGADVISRIQYALKENASELTAAIRNCVEDMTNALLSRTEKRLINTVCIVGNPAMQQLFLGLSVENLAKPPFMPLLKQTQIQDGGNYISVWSGSALLIVPDVAGYIGADTLACMLSTELYKQEELTLLVDIGTNGEMVLGNQHRIAACSTAAGPALEGAHIQFGMHGKSGAIDHVRLENGQFICSVIGGGEAVGICGSGIIDAIAAALDAGLISKRGRIETENRRIHLTDRIYLTQEDVRQVQLAKGAIAAGIELMMAHLGATFQDIQRVCLAGAFGTYMDPASACRIGLLPCALETKITAVGNAAGTGAKILACNRQAMSLAQSLIQQVEALELASIPAFQRSFAKHMYFDTAEDYWCRQAIALGFSNAVPLDVATLVPRQDIRDMCSADKCRAYGKNWTCPPQCGTLSACKEKLAGYRHGILLQTVGQTQKMIDTRAYHRTEQQHLQQFHALAKLLRSRYPNALCLGTGGCRICENCAYPAPCRFPMEACSSMEGYGLFVTQVCRDNGLQYHHGEKTITYTACILF